MMRLHTDDPLLRAAEFLESRPLATHAYALGYLDESYVGYTHATLWPPAGPAEALALEYRGLARPALFVMGSPTAVDALLINSRDSLPRHATLHIPPDLWDVVKIHYRPMQPLASMHRMVLERSHFRDPGPDPQVERLGVEDLQAVLALYAVWPDHLFEPWNLQSGIYFGIRTPSGELASIAGTHNVSSRYDIAAIGNLVTHPEHRQMGYARRCNAQLLATVFRSVGFATLDVQQGNLAAVRTYEHFGFRHQADYLQGAVARL
jgi:ribosomal protein S18 acetylase RimI-like enzyme